MLPQDCLTQSPFRDGREAPGARYPPVFGRNSDHVKTAGGPSAIGHRIRSPSFREGPSRRFEPEERSLLLAGDDSPISVVERAHANEPGSSEAHPYDDRERRMSLGARAAGVAWLITAVYYFYQYALRSAPAVMMPELSAAFGLSTMGVASMAGLFYYGYSPFSLIAGVAMDRLGPGRIVPIGAATVGIGALLFASGNSQAASVGRLLQGAGGVFALIGAAYIATTNFPASRAATLIGATQMFGMAGGSAGQFVVGPMIGAGVTWSAFWVGMGLIGLAMSALLFFLLPPPKPAQQRDDWLKDAGSAFAVVFRNPQSILCGIIAGLLFIPTTIFDMIWGVRYLQDARGLDYAAAVMRSATVPLGWIIGCPLLGLISDRIGRRKPVIVGGASVLLVCMAWILYGRATLFPPYVVGLVAGLASGSAMLP